MTAGTWDAGRGTRFTLRTAALIAAMAIPATVRAQTHLLIVAGLGGEPAYTAKFRTWAESLGTLARTRYGIPDSDVVVLTEDGAGQHVRGISTRENVEQALATFQRRAGAPDQLAIILIGHGSGDGAESRISLPGPDLSAGDFARLLDAWKAHPVAFVDLTSASGDFVRELAGPNRVVITATKSSFERNASVFAGYFVDALGGKSADTDKDGRVSLLEAFRYAQAETQRHYETASTIQTEHAQLDGDVASRFFLDAAPHAMLAGAAAPQLDSLYGRKSTIEEQIAALKSRKTGMSADAYDDALEQLLVQLALNARAIRHLEGR